MKTTKKSTLEQRVARLEADLAKFINDNSKLRQCIITLLGVAESRRDQRH